MKQDVEDRLKKVMHYDFVTQQSCDGGDCKSKAAMTLGFTEGSVHRTLFLCDDHAVLATKAIIAALGLERSP